MKRTLIIAAVLGVMYLAIEVAFGAVGNLIQSIIDSLFNGHKEIDWTLKGTTSLFMLPIGGIMAVILGRMNNIQWIYSRINYFWMSIIGVVLIYAIEYSFGTLLTSLGIVVWRYTDFLNISGQITLLYLPVWFALCPLAFWLEDVVIYYVEFKTTAILNLLDYYKLALNPAEKAGL